MTQEERYERDERAYERAVNEGWPPRGRWEAGHEDWRNSRRGAYELRRASEHPQGWRGEWGRADSGAPSERFGPWRDRQDSRGYRGTSPPQRDMRYGDGDLGYEFYARGHEDGWRRAREASGRREAGAYAGGTFGAPALGTDWEATWHNTPPHSFGRTSREEERAGARSHSFGDAGGLQGRGPKGYRRSDERIREDVSECLSNAPDVDATEIEVGVDGGIVTLNGSVRSRRQKRCAEDCLDGVSGLKDVHNQIRVDFSDGQGSSAQRTAQSQAGSGQGQQDANRKGAPR